MGYRHIMISDTMVPRKEKLPEWFVTKWEGFVDFDRQFWVTHSEYKMYGAMGHFPEDVQKVLQELKLMHDQVQLIWFADEGYSGGYPYITTTITPTKITELVLTEFEQTLFNQRKQL